MYGEVHEARPAISRIKDYRPFLDCNDCTGSDNDYYIKDKINKDSMRHTDVPIKKSQWNNEAWTPKITERINRIINH